MNAEAQFGDGVAFYKSSGRSDKFVPPLGENLREWVHGYAAALADYDPMGDCSSIKAALRNDGIEGETLESLLQVAEAIERGNDCTSEFLPVTWRSGPARHSVEVMYKQDERLASFKGLID
jgi:hypothetical protein